VVIPARPEAARVVPQWTARATGTMQLGPPRSGLDRGMDEGSGRAEGPVMLDPREQVLVSLLATGLTDASAARRLRVSPRTVTNVLRALMDRLGVNNRFQLGLALGLAARRGPQRWQATDAHAGKAAGDC
jgi:DNA-binding NarL/FixJ family response regulator